MRTSEYYAAGIHGFFVGFGLDALDQRPAGPVDTRPAPVVFDRDAAHDFEPDDSTGCFCAATDWPPCSHCENDHEDGA